jgi:micrococcal nuclease
MRWLSIFIVLLIFSCEHPESGKLRRNQKSHIHKRQTDNSFKVVGVKDGDTFVLLKDGQELIIRFEHIDCPEKKQPFGKEAKKFVSNRCYGKYVSLKGSLKPDRYNRIIAEVILEDGTNLNEELIKKGLAWHFKKYSSNARYAELEDNAKEIKIGLWSLLNPIEPWNWRKSSR